MSSGAGGTGWLPGAWKKPAVAQFLGNSSSACGLGGSRLPYSLLASHPRESSHSEKEVRAGKVPSCHRAEWGHGMAWGGGKFE